MKQIYKVFLNNFSIFFTDSCTEYDSLINPVHCKPYKVIDSCQNLIIFLKRVNYIIDQDLLCVGKNPKMLFDAFKLQFQYVVAAGGVVQNTDNKLLIIYKNKYWDLPKGKVNHKESIESAAIREVQEETNVQNLKIVTNLISTYHIYKCIYNDFGFTLKETKWFLMGTNVISNLAPDESEGISAVKWLDPVEMKNLKTYRSINFLLKKSGFL